MIRGLATQNPQIPTALPGRAGDTSGTAASPPITGVTATPSTPFSAARSNPQANPIQSGLGGRDGSTPYTTSSSPVGAGGAYTQPQSAPTPSPTAPAAPQGPITWTPQNGVSYIVQPGDPRYDQAVASGNSRPYTAPSPQPQTDSSSGLRNAVIRNLWGGNPGYGPSHSTFGNSFSPLMQGLSPSFYGQPTTNPNTVNNFGNGGNSNILSVLMSLFGGGGGNLLNSLLGGGNSSSLSGY